MKRLAKQWADFDRLVMPPKEERVRNQTEEMDKAFYGGAMAVLRIIRESGEETIDQVMVDLVEELDAFAYQRQERLRR